MDSDKEESLEKIKEIIEDMRSTVCPIWQCGGELEYIKDRTNWQEPDLKCKNCGNVWKIQKYRDDEVEE